MFMQGPGKGSTGDTGRSSSRTSVFLGQTTQIFVFFAHLLPQAEWAKLWAEVGKEAGWIQFSGMFVPCSQIPARQQFNAWSQESLNYQVCQWLVETSLLRRKALIGERQNGKWIKRKQVLEICQKITLQLKLSLTQEEREECLYSLENIWGAGTEYVENLSGTSVSWGETTALNQNQISIFNDLFLLSVLSSCHSPVYRGE